MSVIGFLVRAELRRRWRSLLAVALLLGVVTAGAAWGAAGARRTVTSYERLADSTNSEDVLVNPDDGFADFDAIAALPQVTDSCQARGAPVAIANERGEPAFDEPVLPLISDGRCLIELPRPGRIDGRLPDLDAPFEVFLSRPGADILDVGPGDTIDAFAFASFDGPPEPIVLEVTGTGLYASDALLDPENQATFPVLALTPAFADRYPMAEDAFFTGLLVRLEGGEAQVADFNADALVAAGESIHFEDRYDNERKARRALEPYAFALWLFAAGIAIAGGGMLGGALHRALTAHRGDDETLAAVGVARRARTTVTVVVGAMVGVVAATTGAAVSIALSPLTPIGSARDIEPDPGLHLDAAVILVAVGATVAFSLLISTVAALVGRRAAARQGEVGVLGRLPLAVPAPQAAGIRLATGALGGARSGARATFVGAALGIIAVLVVEVVGAGITRLVDDPARFGWDWDVMVNVAEEEFSPAAYDERAQVGYRATVGDLDAAGVTERTTISMGQVEIGGVTVAAIGIHDVVGTPVVPTIVGGRAPRNDDEIVLGATSARRAHVAVGDHVRVRSGDRSRELEVVGVATFPRLTEYPGAPNTGLGDGAILTTDTLVELTGALPYAAIAVRAEGAVLEAVRDAIEPYSLSFEGEVSRVERPQRPDALYGYESTAGLRHALAALLGGLAIASVVLGLSGSARSARRELAVLRTVGFTRGQAHRVVHTHGALVAASTVLIGVPLGLAAGRVAWSAFAERLGVGTDPFTPAVTVAAVALAAIAVCAVLAALIAALSIRVSPAHALRSE